MGKDIFALDTNIVIGLYHIYCGEKPSYLGRKSQDFNDSIYHLFDEIMSNESKFEYIITSEVESEILKGIEMGYSDLILQFINDSPIRPVTFNEEEQKKISSLQQKYLGQDKKTKERIGVIFDTQKCKSDSRIEAETVIAGAKGLITNNTIDFIGSDYTTGTRARIIKANSYIFAGKNEFGFPFTPYSFFADFFPDKINKKGHFKEKATSQMDLPEYEYDDESEFAENDDKVLTTQSLSSQDNPSTDN